MYYICKQFKLSGQELFVLKLIVGNEIKKIITIKIEILTFNCPNSFRVGVTKRAEELLQEQKQYRKGKLKKYRKYLF